MARAGSVPPAPGRLASYWGRLTSLTPGDSEAQVGTGIKALGGDSGDSLVGVGGLPAEQTEDAQGEDFRELLAAFVRSVRWEIRRRGNLGCRHGDSPRSRERATRHSVAPWVMYADFLGGCPQIPQIGRPC